MLAVATWLPCRQLVPHRPRGLCLNPSVPATGFELSRVRRLTWRERTPARTGGPACAGSTSASAGHATGRLGQSLSRTPHVPGMEPRARRSAPSITLTATARTPSRGTSRRRPPGLHASFVAELSGRSSHLRRRSQRRPMLTDSTSVGPSTWHAVALSRRPLDVRLQRLVHLDDGQIFIVATAQPDGSRES